MMKCYTNPRAYDERQFFIDKINIAIIMTICLQGDRYANYKRIYSCYQGKG